MSAQPSHQIPDDAPLLRECRAGYDVWRRFASHRTGIWTMFLWSLAEATFWPVIPDAILVPMVVASTRRVSLVAAAVFGSALGGIAIFCFAYSAPSAAHNLLAHLPLVFDRQIALVDRRLDSDGAWALLTQPWSGVSFKIWGVEAGREHLSPPLVIPIFIGARALRMALLAVLASLASDRIQTFIRDFSIFVLIGYAVLFAYGWWHVTMR